MHWSDNSVIKFTCSNTAWADHLCTVWMSGDAYQKNDRNLFLQFINKPWKIWYCWFTSKKKGLGEIYRYDQVEIKTKK